MTKYLLFAVLVTTSSALNAETEQEQLLRQLDDVTESLIEQVKQENTEVDSAINAMIEAIARASKTKEDADALYEAVDRLVSAERAVAYRLGRMQALTEFLSN